MRLYSPLATLILCFTVQAECQTAQSIDGQLTSLWTQSKYNEIEALLDAKATEASPDVAALYCSKVFFVLIRPNKAKAITMMTKLVAAAQGSGNATFIMFAENELREVQSIADAEFLEPSDEVVALLHSEFANAYPNIGVAVFLRKFVQ